MANSITADEIREQFSQAMSAMYQQEVPQYGTLLELVADVNLAVLENNPQLHEKMVNADELARLNVERHGAIRVGTAQELATLRRMFAIMGMYPVSYYDLSQAGVPVHSTAFRPIDDASLATTANPRPCSPARAASTAAFSARIFVWKAILLMTAVISEIFFELVEIAPIVFTTPETVCPPSLALIEASCASLLA